MYKNLNIWLGSYIKQEFRRLFQRQSLSKPAHIIFCFVDHFEPDWNHADSQTQSQRIDEWLRQYPTLAQKHKDADGCFAKHTFFYPAEMYRKEHLEKIAELCKRGIAEVEIHLHHDNDTEQGLREKLEKAKSNFLSHGLLGKDKNSGEIRFGFIHGNWALNNSRRDGRWCGVNNETRVLKDAGCYADFTLPSAPSDTQTTKINSIYYASNHNNKPKSHNTGIDVALHGNSDGDTMIIQGPLALNWKMRKFGIFPKVENAEISGTNFPTSDRVDLWIRQRIGVKEKQDWIFVKVHAHGAKEENAKALLNKPLDEMFSYLEEKYNDGMNFILHYVSARQMYNIIKAAEAGETESPRNYRDYVIEKNK